MDLSRNRVPPLTRRADLHVHSTASDGTVPPALVVQRAREVGLAAIALTDHDTLAGVPEAVAAGAEFGVRVVSGCEFSVEAPWGEMHALGYFLPVNDPVIERFLTEARERRFARTLQMVERLVAWGVDITLADVRAEAGSGALGRPHVARALVRLGKVPDVQSAFDEFLGMGRRAYVPKVLPRIETVAALVHGAGGILSAAHLRDRGNRTVLAMLKARGFDAVEARHPRHSMDLAVQILEAAKSLDMLPTGGTDWHGDGAFAEPLGAQAVPMVWLDAMDKRAIASAPPARHTRSPVA